MASRMGVSPASTMAAVVAASCGHVGDVGTSGGWLGRSPQWWRLDPDMVGCSCRMCLGPSSCQGGVTERKLRASALTAATPDMDMDIGSHLSGTR